MKCYECGDGVYLERTFKDYFIGGVVMPKLDVLECNICGDVCIPYESATQVDDYRERHGTETD